VSVFVRRFPSVWKALRSLSGCNGFAEYADGSDFDRTAAPDVPILTNNSILLIVRGNDREHLSTNRMGRRVL